MVASPAHGESAHARARFVNRAATATKTRATSSARACCAAEAFENILAEGAMTLPVTLSGGVLFAS